MQLGTIHLDEKEGTNSAITFGHRRGWPSGTFQKKRIKALLGRTTIADLYRCYAPIRSFARHDIWQPD